MAIDMGTIFRYSAKGSPVVTLKEEVAITRSYVRIQENRFMGRLKVFFMIPENLQKLEVRKCYCSLWWKMQCAMELSPRKRAALFLSEREKRGTPFAYCKG